jgi:hypothetical protein
VHIEITDGLFKQSVQVVQPLLERMLLRHCMQDKKRVSKMQDAIRVSSHLGRSLLSEKPIEISIGFGVVETSNSASTTEDEALQTPQDSVIASYSLVTDSIQCTDECFK